MQGDPHQMGIHKKQNFLVERIAFFSDAVFAIAITLMIIEIHPPVLKYGDNSSIAWRKLLEKGPEFLGLIVSFILIGAAWIRHHQLFKYIATYDVRFLVINLALLFTIILFPFSNSFLFNSLFEDIVTKPQVIFYLGVPLLTNTILYLMFRMANKKHVAGQADKDFHKAILEQGFMVLSFFLSLTWVIVIPLRYHYFGYIFLGIGPVLTALMAKSNKRKPLVAK